MSDAVSAAIASAVAAAIAEERTRTRDAEKRADEAEKRALEAIARLALSEKGVSAAGGAAGDGAGSAAGDAAAGRVDGRLFPAGVSSALCAAPLLVVPSSPFKCDPLELAPFASFDSGAAPLSLELRELSAAPSFAAFAPDAPLHEVDVNRHVTAFVPPWIEAVVGRLTFRAARRMQHPSSSAVCARAQPSPVRQYIGAARPSCPRGRTSSSTPPLTAR